MKAHRQHGPAKRTARPPSTQAARARSAVAQSARDGSRRAGRADATKRASSGAPTGALVRPAAPASSRSAKSTTSARATRSAAAPAQATASTASAAPPKSGGSARRGHSRYGDNGVASLGEARAHRRLRLHHRAAAQPNPRHRDRRTIRTTKPLLSTRFGAGRPRFRLIATLICLMLVLGVVMAKVGLMQGGRGQALRASANELWTRTRTLPAQRGAIFDRNGDELALSVPAATVAVNPQQIVDVPGTVAILAQLLRLDDATRAELQADIEASTNGFMYVARQIDPTVAAQISDLELIGVSTYPEDRRIMPGGETGRSVIGRTDIDGVGTAGLELQYNDRLEGVAGQMNLEVAPGGRTIAGTEQVVQPAIAGTDIIISLDRSVQYATEQALIRRVNETGAIGGQVIVMETDTGSIVAMATVNRRDGVAMVSTGNWSAVGAYEPGSVGKVITLAGAIEDGAVTPATSYVVPWQHDCTDNPADGILSDSHQHGPMPMSVRDILVESSNVGTIYVGQEIGYERQYHYLTEFGLGRVSDLGFPGESPGILEEWQEWEGTERCTMSYGQGLASTPVQLVTAVNVIANDGLYVAPRLVTGTVGADGELTEAATPSSHRVVSEQTAMQMQTLMRDVVCNGTADDAQVEGISVAGKTGTAYKAQQDGTYYNADGITRDYYSSFVGFFPAEDPQVTILISIDEPQSGFNSGAQSAAPLFRELVPTMVHELDVQSPPGSTDCAGS